MVRLKTLLPRWFFHREIIIANPERRQYLLYGLIAFLISIFTFPKFFPEIQLGLDGSETFAFNYLFYHHIQFGTKVVFTYGPLGFISSPTCIGNNLLIAIIFSFTVRFIFIYSFLILGYLVSRRYRILHLILVIGCCNIMYLDMAFIGGTILAMLIYHLHKKIVWVIIACLLTSLALLVKSSFGLMCISVLFSYVLYNVITTKRVAVILYVTLFISLFLILTWLLLYHNVSGILTYFWSIIQFSEGNSNVLQLEVTNHWGILIFALVFFYLPAFLTNNEITKVLYIISTLALYAAFKYSFAREENWHELFLFIFVILICSLFLLINSHIKLSAVMLPLAAISLLYANMVMTGTYDIDDKKRITGIGNFIRFITDYSNTIKNVKINDSLTLQNKILDNEQRTLIGNNTVDCYPMELTYVAANNLNWTPRPNLQIGAYTPWLDHYNAAFFSTLEAPRFYIWELEQPPLNNYSFDDRYLLNEDPQSTFSFFNHYKLLRNNSKTALFKHADYHLLSDERVIKSTIGYMNKWLPVLDADSNSITRAKIHFVSTFKGILKKTFYKDQVYFIDYKLENGSVKSYRFVPINAESGLWINPLVIDVTRELKGLKVDSIRIRASESESVYDTFIIDWTKFTLKDASTKSLFLTPYY